MLITLVSSHFLQTGDLAAFYGQAANASQRVGVIIVLRDALLDQQVLNTAFPWGASVAEGTRPPLSAGEVELLRSGKPVLTDVFSGHSWTSISYRS